ncbi:MAG TPA: hypothetical protein VF070_02290 [Streptosporangiaceae bacterium]
MSTPNAAASRRAHALRAAVAGDVFVPGDHGYDQAAPGVEPGRASAARCRRVRRVRGRRGSRGSVSPGHDAKYLMFAGGFALTPKLGDATLSGRPGTDMSTVGAQPNHYGAIGSSATAPITSSADE